MVVHLVVTKGRRVGMRQLVMKTEERAREAALSFHLTEMKQLPIGSLQSFPSASVPIAENIVALCLRQSSSSPSSLFRDDEFV